MKSERTAVLIRNKTRLEQLTEKFNTKAQAKFYFEQNQEAFYQAKASKASSFNKKQQFPTLLGITTSQTPTSGFDDFEIEHQNFYQALETVQKTIGNHLKIKVLERSFLPNYTFAENDIVVVLGQDGLVANTAKYTKSIPIIAVNPDSSRYDGILLPFSLTDFEKNLINVVNDNYNYKMVTMAEALLNDGQRLLAFNDLFIGPVSHTSARYKISFNGISERHSSSGIIVSTGAGSTGWLSSIFNMTNSVVQTFSQQKIYTNEGNYQRMELNWEDNKLVFITREPFLSKSSQISLSAGIINNENELIIESLMPDNGVIFSDGIEADCLKFNSGAIATIKIADEKAKLVTN